MRSGALRTPHIPIGSQRALSQAIKVSAPGSFKDGPWINRRIHDLLRHCGIPKPGFGCSVHQFLLFDSAAQTAADDYSAEVPSVVVE